MYRSFDKNLKATLRQWILRWKQTIIVAYFKFVCNRSMITFWALATTWKDQDHTVYVQRKNFLLTLNEVVLSSTALTKVNFKWRKKLLCQTKLASLFINMFCPEKISRKCWTTYKDTGTLLPGIVGEKTSTVIQHKPSEKHLSIRSGRE